MRTMKAAFLFFALWALLTLAQYPSQMGIAVPAPPPVAVVGATYRGTEVPAGAKIYYWVVTTYPSGKSLPAGPATAFNTVGSVNLTAANDVLVSWSGVSGATSYDVIKSTSQESPVQYGSCTNCLVVLGTTNTSFEDEGPPAGAYSMNPAAPAVTAVWTINNTGSAAPYINTTLLNSVYRMPLIAGYIAGRCAQYDADGNLTYAVAACNTAVIGSASWGGITGTMSAQTDLNTALGLRELTAAKNAANGYAGLTSGTKLTAAQGQEVWSIADLSDMTGKQGTGTVAAMTAGAFVSGNSVNTDVNGNMVDSGGVAQLVGAKDGASGYAGLTSGTKLNAAQGQEVWALGDLTDAASKQGDGTAVQMSSGSLTAGYCVTTDAGGNTIGWGAPCGSIGTGTYAARPAAAAGNTGDIYIDTDAAKVSRSTGSAWVEWYPIFKLSPVPLLNTWTALNQGSITIADNKGGISIAMSVDANEQVRGVVRAAPSTPYHVVYGFMLDWFQISTTTCINQVVLGWRQSSDGKLHGAAIGVDRNSTTKDFQLVLNRWSNESTYVSTDFATQSISPRQIYWVRIGDDGTTNRTIDMSGDGINWTNIWTGSRTTYLTGDQVMFAAGLRGTAGLNSFQMLLSYAEGP